MKRTIPLLAALAMLATLTVPAWAITRGGVPDGDDHPFVGVSVYFDAEGDPLWRCSGAMISPTVYVTAGHCTTEPAVSAKLFFDADVADNDEYFDGDAPTGATASHPEYFDPTFYLHDVGVVVLDEPLAMDAYASLPEEGVLDEYRGRGKRDGTLTVVGYGLQRVRPSVQADLVRRRADLDIVDLIGTGGLPYGTAVILEGNSDSGGTCSGDSGGPQLLEGTVTIAAVTSFGYNAPCGGVGGGYRIDQADDLAFIEGFLDAPEEADSASAGKRGRAGR